MDTTQATRLQTASNTSLTDTRRVFSYSGGVPHLTIDAKSSGLDCNPIKSGSLLLHVPMVHNYRGMFNSFQGRYSQHSLTINPIDSARTVEKKFHLTADFGFRVLRPLTEIPYTLNPYHDPAFEYFYILHPKILCEFGLETEIYSNTEGNVGAHWYQACPTCRLKELESEDCSQRIYEAGARGFDTKILADTRAILADACRSAIAIARRKVAELEGDIQKRMSGEHGRNVRNEIDYIYLKMIHQKVTPQDNTGGVTQMASAIAEAIKGNNAPAPAVMNEQLAALYARLEQLENEKKSSEAVAVAPTVKTPVEPVETPSEPASEVTFSAGDEVFVDGKPAIVVAKPFGKITVQFADETKATVTKDEVTLA